MMFEEMEKWIGGLGPEDAEKIIQALTKVSTKSIHSLIARSVFLSIIPNSSRILEVHMLTLGSFVVF